MCIRMVGNTAFKDLGDDAEQQDWSIFLSKSGVILLEISAHFHCVGTIPSDSVKQFAQGAISTAASFKREPGLLSGPHALLGSKA